MSFQSQTKMTCDRCGHTEVTDSYVTSCLGWTHLKVGTFKAVLFPGQRACSEGQRFEQDRWVCPTCTAEFVGWMQPGRLAVLTGALAVLVDELRLLKASSGKHKTRAEALSFVVERLNKVLEVGR